MSNRYHLRNIDSEFINFTDVKMCEIVMMQCSILLDKWMQIKCKICINVKKALSCPDLMSVS